MENHTKEEAVSPVIGVILMVAITVILAAVIAAFVIPMASNVSTTKIVAVTVKPVGTNITVTYHGGQDHINVSSLVVMIDGANTSTIVDPNVGETWTFDEDYSGSAQNRVVIVAKFTDGSKQVIYDGYVGLLKRTL